jgi:hypothetical protein
MKRCLGYKRLPIEEQTYISSDFSSNIAKRDGKESFTSKGN